MSGYEFPALPTQLSITDYIGQNARSPGNQGSTMGFVTYIGTPRDDITLYRGAREPDPLQRNDPWAGSISTGLSS